MTLDPQWDDEFDVVCTDAGVAGLSGAIAAVDEGAEALVAHVQPPESAVAQCRRLGWFTPEAGDAETMAYLADLAADLDVAALPQLDDDLPIRAAPQAFDAIGRKVLPFHGSELREWAARCIPSPSGYLYTRVTDWSSSAMKSGDCDAFEVAVIGSLQPGSGDLVGSVLDWLDAEAHTRGVDIQPVLGFERLVFSGGEVAGAAFSTAQGPLAIRARHGVLFCRNELSPGRAHGLPGVPANGDAALRVALVGKAASRFGRVELLTP